MSYNPLVSVCIPAHNAEKYISESLESLLKQSYNRIEIIVVDDGSTDRTLQILQSYKKRGIKIIEQENKGQCTAANKAYFEATGKYIKFMDADDVLSKDFIKNQVEILSGRTDVIASASWGRFYNDDSNTFKLNPESIKKDILPIDWLVESLWIGPNMMQCALWLIPRNVLYGSGLWNEALSLINDFDFYIRVLLAAKEIKFTSNAILYYRSGLSNSLSGQKTRKAYESAYLSTELGVKSILNFENSERTKKICATCFQEWKYQFYPQEMDLYRKSKEWVNKLGGSNYPFPAGGITLKLISILGWRLTKRLKCLLQIT